MGHAPRRTWAAVAAAVVLAGLLPFPTPVRAAAERPREGWGSRVRLARVSFDPAKGAPATPRSLTDLARRLKTVASATSSDQLWLVQLHVPVSRAGQVALGRVALRPLAVVPDATYLMRGSAGAATAARALKSVRAVVPFPAWAKVVKGVETASRGTELTIAAMPDRPGVPRIRTARVTTPAALAALVGDPTVGAVAVRSVIRPLNANARWVTQSAVRASTPLTDHGLLGDGEVAGIVDTGMAYALDRNGTANWFFSDCTNPAQPTAASCKVADNTYQAPNTSPGDTGCSGSGDMQAGAYARPRTGHRKVLAYFNLVAECEAVAGDSGGSTHGSHVSGSLLGDHPPYGVANGDDGMAPRAKVVFQDVGGDEESLAGLPADYFELLSQAYEPARLPSGTRGSSGAATPEDTVGPYVRGTGARVHSASIGSAVPIVSLGEASRLDDFVTNNEDMTVVVSAGNAGPDMATIGEPGVAKDAITSGAMANGASDFVSLDSLANFSSHGAALVDGQLPNLARIKPDVVDPGLRIVSPKGGTNTETHVLQGTSMSAPVLSGNAVLVRQYFEDGFGPGGPPGTVVGFASGRRATTGGFNPSAALVKAVIVNSGQRMRGKYTGAVGTNRELDGQWPSAGQGWGRVQLDRALHFDDVAGSPNLWVADVPFCPPPRHCAGDTGAGVATGDDVTYTVDVGPGQPLKVILAWSDPGGLSSFLGIGTDEVVVNQLALQVDGPGGTSYCGNRINTMATPSADVATSLPGACNPLLGDRLNNVHGVYLPNPAPGRYTIHVKGDLVMQDQNAIGLSERPLTGRQGYALAATGRFTAVPAVTAPAPPAATITGASVSAPSADLAVVRFSTNVPTTASVTLTSDTGAAITRSDVYSRPASAYPGVALVQVENDGQFLNKPVRATEHIVKFTGLSPGARYRVSFTATGGATPVEGALAVTTPAGVFAPQVAADTATLFSADTTTGEPFPDETAVWGHSGQLYVGAVPATTQLLCDILELPICGPINVGSAFKFRLPAGVALETITGAVVVLSTRHDLASRVLGAPTHQVVLLADSAEATWGPGTSYEDVFSAPADIRVGAPTAYRSVPYVNEAFTVPCSDLTKLRANLVNREAAFRIELGGDSGTSVDGFPLTDSLYAWESGFGRRTSGLEFRPRLVLFTTGDPLGQSASGPPLISDVRTERVDATTAVVHWRTSQPANSLVLLRKGGAPDVVQVGAPMYVTEHHVTVKGVGRGDGWQFALRSVTPQGDTGTAINGGKGWRITDDPVKPPGPALAAAGVGPFAASIPTDATATAADRDAGTGLGCVAGAVAATDVGGTGRLPPTGLGGPGPAAGLTLTAAALVVATLTRRRRT